MGGGRRTRGCRAEEERGRDGRQGRSRARERTVWQRHSWTGGRRHKTSATCPRPSLLTAALLPAAYNHKYVLSDPIHVIYEPRNRRLSSAFVAASRLTALISSIHQRSWRPGLLNFSCLSSDSPSGSYFLFYVSNIFDRYPVPLGIVGSSFLKRN